MSVKEDLANRSPDIHWPEGFTPADADLFAHNEISINAPLGVTCGHPVRSSGRIIGWPLEKATTPDTTACERYPVSVIGKRAFAGRITSNSK